jgi:oligopeptide/dipeptide ABC transporter ATP-binding protein
VSAPLLEVENLNVVYHRPEGTVTALHDVSFAVRPGEIVGIVGESGCGKSTLSSALLRLLPANGEIASGRILFKGRDISGVGTEEMRRLRGAELAMIFQDPLTSLNPVFDVGTQMLDAQRAHRQRGEGDDRELRRRAVEALERVGIPDPGQRIDDYPHQFSGGMRQRIMIATALSLEPELLIADEATSALDVTLEAQILELLIRLRDQGDRGIIFVSHDLGVVSQVCDRVLVMYAGRVVEEADVVSLFERPRHPYTRALLAAVPSYKRRGERLVTIPGRVPGLAEMPPGCKFANRCPAVRQACLPEEPRVVPREDDGGGVRCVIYDPLREYEASAP